MALAGEYGPAPVPSFHRDLVAGVATGAAELHAQAGHLDVVYVPVGQGSGICAHIAMRDLLGLDPEVVGVVAGAARFVRVTEEAAERAMRTLWQTTHQMPEPAGAIALAGLLADTGRTPNATAAVVMSGGNCDHDLVRRVVASS